MKALKNKHILLLTIACLAIFFTNLDALYVNIMEARNFTTAREMLHDNNWLLTTLNGEARYEKPPLPTWLTAIAGALFGISNEAALRIPAALVTYLLIIIFYTFTVKLCQKKTLAFVGSLILMTSFYVVFAGRNGQWDIFTHAFMMVCIYYLFQLFNTTNENYNYALLAGLFFGASFLSKGPVSLYALLLPFLMSYFIVFRSTEFKKKLLPLLLFMLVAVVLSGWWYWYTYTFDTAAVTRIANKETGNWTNYNIRPFYYYWSFFTQSGVWTIPAFISLLYPYLKNRVKFIKAYTFSFLWTMISVILLSLIPEKKSRYLLPVLIPLALNTAFYIDYLFKRFSKLDDKRETIPVYINFGLIAIIGIAFPVVGYFILKDSLHENWYWYILLSVSLAGIGIYMLGHLRRKKIRPVFYGTIAFIAAIMCFGMPMARALTVNDQFKAMSQLTLWQKQNNINVYEFSFFTPELVWDYGRSLPIIKKNGITKLPKETRFGVLVAQQDQKEFLNTFENFTVEKITTYDMNPKGPEDSSHKTRLWRYFYIVSTP